MNGNLTAKVLKATLKYIECVCPVWDTVVVN